MLVAISRTHILIEPISHIATMPRLLFHLSPAHTHRHLITMSYREDSVWFDHSRSLSRAASSTGGSTGGSNRATLDRSGSTALVPTTDDDENDSDSDDGSDHIIMAVDQRGSKMGCAYYTAADETLSFMEDVELPSADCFDARTLTLDLWVGGWMGG